MANSSEEQLETAEEEVPIAESQGSGKLHGAVHKLREKASSVYKPLIAKVLHSKRNRIVGSIVGGLLLVLAVYLLFFRGNATYKELQDRSLKILAEDDSANNRREVDEIAKRLLAEDFRDPDFAGGAEFLSGIVAFRNAMEKPKSERELGLKRAIRYLKEARNHGVPLKYIPELSYAMGVSLFDIGSSLEAREYLETAVHDYSSGKIEAGLRLIDVFLDQPTPKLLDRSLKLCQSLLVEKNLNQQQQQRLFLQKSQIHLNLQQYRLAQESLESVSDLKTGNRALQIFQARTLMTQGAAWLSGRRIRSGVPLSSLVFRATGVEIYEKTLELLRPIALKSGVDKTFSKQAFYLLGLAAEKLADDREQERDSIRYDEAINYYLQTAQLYSGSHEGIAANLKVANLLRKSGRDEEALLGFQKALHSLDRNDTFRNRWLSKIEFEDAVVKAWQAWIDQARFENAIELSRSMYPLISNQRALQFLAIARQQWAEHIAKSLPTTPFRLRADLKKNLLEKWKQSGRAYSRLANAMASTNRYREMLWIAADHYRKGHDFEKSLEHYTRFINSNPKRRLAEALVKRGEVLIDLDRLDRAIEHFQKVIATYKTDPAYFKALYLLGLCYKEKNEPEKAESIWRNILTSPLLEPTAQEWKNALFALSQFIFNQTSSEQALLDPQYQKNKSADYEARFLKLHRRWNDTVQQFQEFLKRYPQESRRNEARFMLAKSLHYGTKYLQFKLSQAETANRRQELEREIIDKLIQARDEFRSLQKSLLDSKDQKLFSREEQLYLIDCYFDIAHTIYDLAAFSSDYERAIIAYNSAVNRYPQDPRVLLSYLQIADCNLKLSKIAEARSVLVQARVILRQFPDSVFDSPNTNFSRKDWESWIDLFLKFNLDNSQAFDADSTVNRMP